MDKERRIPFPPSPAFFCFMSLFPIKGLNFIHTTILHQPLSNCMIIIVKFIWLGEILFFSLHIEVIVELGIDIRFEYLSFHCCIY